LEYTIIIVATLSVESIFLSTYLTNTSNELKEDTKDNTKDSNKDNNINRPKKPKALLDFKFINNSSDFLTQMNIIVSLLNILSKNSSNYKYNNALREFCTKYCLNMKLVNEVLSLNNQLRTLCEDIFKLNKNKWSANLEIPSSKSQLLLFQIILSGLIDNIARKKIIYDNSGNEVDNKQNKKEHKKKIIYECNENNVECQIHTDSMLSKELPNYVAYKEIIQDSNKANLVTVMAIQPEWIFNLGGELVNYSFEKLNLNLEPLYSNKDDIIYCFLNMKYGYKSWEINNVKVEMTETNSNNVIYRWFARLLLEGKIIDGFKAYTKFLDPKPNVLTNPVCILPKVTSFINLFKLNKISTKKELLSKITTNKNK